MFTIIHRVITENTMTRLRNAVRKTITQHQVEISQHHWNKDEIKVTKLGYVIGLHPVHYSNKEAQKKMMQLIKKSDTSVKMPPFKMVLATPQLKDNLAITRTKVFAFELKSKDVKNALKILKKTSMGELRFLPFNLKYKHKATFIKAIKLQNKTMQQTYVAPLVSVTKSMMFYLKEQIVNIEGVQDVIATTQTPNAGRWNILIDKKMFHSTRETL